jgi:hypothetical protein
MFLGTSGGRAVSPAKQTPCTVFDWFRAIQPEPSGLRNGDVAVVPFLEVEIVDHQTGDVVDRHEPPAPT